MWHALLTKCTSTDEPSGSAAELETQLELCVRLSFIDREDVREVWQCLQRVARMLTRLIPSVCNMRLKSTARPAPNAEFRTPQ